MYSAKTQVYLMRKKYKAVLYFLFLIVVKWTTILPSLTAGYAA